MLPVTWIRSLRNTKRRPSFDVPLFWYTHQIKQPERRRDKKSKSSIASLRARRQSRVNQRERDSVEMRRGGEVRPNLRFDKKIRAGRITENARRMIGQ